MKTVPQKDFDARCVCCGRKVEPYAPDEPHFMEAPAESGVWSGGMVRLMMAGYGSRHDCRAFLVAICDDCVTAKADAGVVVAVGDYPTPFQKSPA